MCSMFWISMPLHPSAYGYTIFKINESFLSKGSCSLAFHTEIYCELYNSNFFAEHHIVVGLPETCFFLTHRPCKKEQIMSKDRFSNTHTQTINAQKTTFFLLKFYIIIIIIIMWQHYLKLNTSNANCWCITLFLRLLSSPYQEIIIYF